jgi:hypothetical protein
MQLVFIRLGSSKKKARVFVPDGFFQARLMLRQAPTQMSHLVLLDLPFPLTLDSLNSGR